MLKLFRPAPVIDPLPKERVDKEYKKLRLQVFLGIFIGYAGYYLVRKNFSIAMPCTQPFTNKMQNISMIESELTVHGIRPITVIITAEAINPKGMNTRALLWSETVPITNLLIP